MARQSVAPLDNGKAERGSEKQWRSRAGQRNAMERQGRAEEGDATATHISVMALLRNARVLLGRVHQSMA